MLCIVTVWLWTLVTKLDAVTNELRTKLAAKEKTIRVLEATISRRMDDQQAELAAKIRMLEERWSVAAGTERDPAGTLHAKLTAIGEEMAGLQTQAEARDARVPPMQSQVKESDAQVAEQQAQVAARDARVVDLQTRVVATEVRDGRAGGGAANASGGDGRAGGGAASGSGGATRLDE